MIISPNKRRILAVVVGVFTLLMAFARMIIGSELIKILLSGEEMEIPISEAPGPRPYGWDFKYADFYLISILALLLSTGGSTALSILIPRRDFNKRAWIYILFLLIILPMTWFNYLQEDRVYPMGQCTKAQGPFGYAMQEDPSDG